MKNEVIFDQYDYFEGFFFGALNGRKNFFKRFNAIISFTSE